MFALVPNRSTQYTDVFLLGGFFFGPALGWNPGPGLWDLGNLGFPGGYCDSETAQASAINTFKLDLFLFFFQTHVTKYVCQKDEHTRFLLRSRS